MVPRATWSHEVEIEVDGVVAPLSFVSSDDLESVARDWVRSSELRLRGGGCESAACVVSVVVGAMREASSSAVKGIVAEAMETCAAGETSSLSFFGANESVGALALEDIAGLCLYAASALSPWKKERALGIAVEAAGEALAAEPDRAHAAKFGMMAAMDLGVPLRAAFFGRELARMKRPPRGPSLVREKDAASRVAGAPGVVAPDFFFEFEVAHFAGLHDAALEFQADQFRWLAFERPDLARRSCGSVDLETLASAARGLDIFVDAAKRWRQMSRKRKNETTTLSQQQQQHLPLSALGLFENNEDVANARALRGRAVCIVTADTQEASTVRSLGNDTVAGATAAFHQRGVAVVDDFLTPETAAKLRDFVLGSTAFTRTYINGYLGCFLFDGFGASPLVQRLARDLRDRVFPELLRDATLRQAWAYVYARKDDSDSTRSHPKGIDPHADDADVSVNIWLTPDESNRARDNRLGGLVIYDRRPPTDWDFSQANADSLAIYDLLDHYHAPSIVVPYKFNRATLLDGFRFHKTDLLDFKPGYTHHRINLTFLFRRQRTAHSFPS